MHYSSIKSDALKLFVIIKEDEENMNIGFIHIGLMKTASTYMQNIWRKDKFYALSWKGTLKFLENLKRAVRNDDTDKYVELDINIDDNQFLNADQYMVISNEGFSTAFLNEIVFQDRIPSFIDFASKNIGRVADKTPNLLIVIREPVSWIRSMYIQSIKQGWSGSAQDFIDKQGNFIRHSLDMEHIIKCYERYFNNILVLPYELFKKNESLFWDIISYSFNIPVIKTRINKRLNESLDLKRVFILSKLNETSHIITDAISNSKEYTDYKEKKYLTNTFTDSGKWIHRRYVEYANDEQINRMYALFNIKEVPDNFLKFKIPPELLNDIQLKFISFLKNNITPEYPEYYESELQNHIRS
jgi:hypothetical protein